MCIRDRFKDGIRRPDRDNAIDVYLSDEYEDVLAEGVWQNTFKVKPEVLTLAEKKEWIAQNTGVTVGSDAFFPFGDNVERARKSGAVSYTHLDNAAILAAQMIALSDEALAGRLAQFKAEMAAEVAAKDEKVRAQFS